MKTVLVVYSNEKKVSVSEYGYMKRYAFNTDSKVKVGDMIKTREYNTNIVIVRILDKAYKFFNKITGELKDEITNSMDFEIRTLKLSKGDDVVVGTKVKK